MTDIDAVCEAVVQAKNAEIEKLRAEIQRLKDEEQRLLAMQLGDQWKLTDRIQRMTAIVEAAKAWREAYNLPFDPGGCYEVRAASRALIAAIDAARGKL